jgi:predicted ester cyclase
MKHLYCFRFVGLIALVLLVACGRDVDSINMSEAEEANKALVLQMFAAIDAQDFDQLRQIFAEDFELHYVGEPEPIDRETTFDLIRGFYTAFPDYVHVIEETVAEGDQVALKMNYRATHQAEFEGIPPTGNPISYAGAQIVTIENGMVTKVWALEDILGLMSQLGMELKPKK